MISTTSSPAKVAFLESLGVPKDHIINYRTHPNWSAQVLRITNGRGVDHVVEVGGSSTIEQSLLSVRLGGLISMIGFLSEGKKTDLVLGIIFGAKTCESFKSVSCSTRSPYSNEWFFRSVRGVYNISKPMNQALVKFLQEKELHPVIAKTFEWEDAKQAFSFLQNFDGSGKIVIRI